MSKITLAEKSQLDVQNQTLQQINAKIVPIDLSKVYVGVLDFVHDDITITSGGLEQYQRRITT